MCRRVVPMLRCVRAICLVPCCCRRIEQLETSAQNEVATLPLTQPAHGGSGELNVMGMGMRSASHGSLDDPIVVAPLTLKNISPLGDGVSLVLFYLMRCAFIYQDLNYTYRMAVPLSKHCLRFLL